MNARIAHVSLSALGGVALAGCIAASDPAGAPATQDKPAPAPAMPQAGSARYEIDPVHTTVIFRIEHLGVSAFHGRFNGPSGSFTFDPAQPGAATFQVKVQAEKVDTGSDDRDKHLRSPDFFNARQFPEITFTSTGVQPAGSRGLRVSGDLSLHGVTRPVTADLEHIGCASDPWGGFRCGFEGRITINRSDYGMKFMLGPVGDEVELRIGIEGTRK